MEQFLDEYGYIALLIGTFFEGETAILVASSLIHAGLFEAPHTVIIAFSGSFISDWMYYLIGRLNGKYFLDKRPKLHNKVLPIKNFFLRHKTQILLSYRFLYGFRVIIPLVVGMSGVRPAQFLFYSVVSGLIWAAVVSSLGYSVGRFLDVKTDVFEENLLYIVLGFAAFGMLVGYLIKKFTMKEMHIPAD